MPTQSTTTEKAEELRKSLKAAAKDVTDSNIRLAKLLFDAYFTKVDGIPIVETWGFESFEEYVERELEIHFGPAVGLIRVYDEFCIKHSFPEGVLPQSITKLRDLAKISRAERLGKAHLLKWIRDARDMSCCELKNAIDEELGHKAKKKTLSFYVKWGQAKTMMKTLRQAKETFGVDSKSEALQRIVAEWEENANAPRARVRRLAKAG
jgi:hypothetical protein